VSGESKSRMGTIAVKLALSLLTFVLASALVMGVGPALGEAPTVPRGGEILWTERYSPGLASRSLAVSPDGTRVYVTGTR
jgi:DNA-binding beta-propeller fold protein YncE